MTFTDLNAFLSWSLICCYISWCLQGLICLLNVFGLKNVYNLKYWVLSNNICLGHQRIDYGRKMPQRHYLAKSTCIAWYNYGSNLLKQRSWMNEQYICWVSYFRMPEQRRNFSPFVNCLIQGTIIFFNVSLFQWDQRTFYGNRFGSLYHLASTMGIKWGIFSRDKVLEWLYMALVRPHLEHCM